MVAVLFVTGFMSAGLTAPLVGVWADQQCARLHFADISILSTFSVAAGGCALYSA